MSSAPVLLQSPEAATEPLHSGAVRIFASVLDVLRQRRGLDFSEYRRGTLERRLANRIVAARVTSADAYLELLGSDEGEADRLIASLTIKVSRFYRNAAVFDSLRTALSDLRRDWPDVPLRAWSAGCAGGEEAYTLAMLLRPTDALILATDIDESALEIARRGVYPYAAFSETPRELREAFIEPAGKQGTFRVADDLRKRVELVRHDLSVADAPPAGAPFHIITCRNVLIYFARPLQERAMHLLCASLAPGGLLCLGEAEWPVAMVSSLEIVDRRGKIFRRI